MQVKLEANVAKSAKYYGINLNLISSNDDGETEDGNEADVEGEGLDADLATGNKDTCVLEVIQIPFYFLDSYQKHISRYAIRYSSSISLKFIHRLTT